MIAEEAYVFGVRIETKESTVDEHPYSRPGRMNDQKRIRARYSANRNAHPRGMMGEQNFPLLRIGHKESAVSNSPYIAVKAIN